MRVPHAALRRPASFIAICGLVAALNACSTPVSVEWPAKVTLDAQPNGIAVRPSDGTVFITDDRTSSVLSSNGGAFAPYASIPVPAGQGKSLSQVSVTGSGDVAVERFGFGTASAIFLIAANGTTSELTGLDGSRRRLGLLAIGPGQLLSSWFIKNSGSPPQGGLSLVTYDAQTHAAVERDLLTGLGKPVGIAVTGGNVFVSDQANNAILKMNLAALLSAAAPTTPTLSVRIENPDLMAADGQGRLYTKCNKNGLCEIAADGTVTVLANDFQEPRGVAVDDSRDRLYAIDRAASAGATSYLRTFSLK
jgi:DNA-binding beta-propeller fold protein YncE